MQPGAMLRPDEMGDDQKLVMYPGPIDEERFRGLLVITTNREVKEAIASLTDIPPAHRAARLASVRAALRQYTNRQLIDMDTNSQAWRNWCDDVVVYHALNHVATGAMIPTQLPEALGIQL